jgi:serine/threonine protein phosphatase PrpC
VPDDIIFAELHMAYGEQQESSELVGVARSPVFSLFKRRRGQLFTIVEPSLPAAEQLCRQLIQTIEDEYFRDSSRTVTSSLRQALLLASETLRAENAKDSSGVQVRVGISCAAIRDGDAYIAQVAPGTAFILHDNSVKRVFATSAPMPEGDNRVDRAPDPLDISLEPQVSFAYSPLAEGDVIVLASGANWMLIPEKQILDAGKHMDPEMTAADLYGHYLAHARRPNTSLVVIRVSQLPVRKRRDVPQRAAKPAVRSDARVEAVPDSTPQVPSMPRGAGRPEAGRSGPSSSVDSGLSGYPAPPGARPAAETGAKQNQPGLPTRPAERPVPWRQLPPTADRGRGPVYPPGPALAPVGKPSVKLRGDWSQSRSAPSPLPGLLLKIVLMLALAALFVVVGRAGIDMWESWQLGDPVALLDEAELKRSQASGEADPSNARALLVESHDLLNRALRASADESTRELISSVRSEVDRIDQAVRISDVTVVVDYSAIADEEWNLARLLIDGSNLYVLDEGMDRVFLYELEPNGETLQDPSKHPVLVKRGDKMDGGVVGDLLSLTWMPTGQLRTVPAMFALESGRSIVIHDPKLGLSRIEVTESQRWGNIQAVSGFAGGLYLLDTKQQVVFYYPPTKNGYESQPYTIVDSKSRIDLSKALDIALDGNLYLLGGEGEIARFSREGRPLEFDGKLPDGPMRGASGLFASANTRSLYVIDRGAERIVQFSPEGALQRQFRADGVNTSFQGLRDIFVDEASRKVYVLAHKSLFVFDLPPMQ